MHTGHGVTPQLRARLASQGCDIMMTVIYIFLGWGMSPFVYACFYNSRIFSALMSRRPPLDSWRLQRRGLLRPAKAEPDSPNAEVGHGGHPKSREPFGVEAFPRGSKYLNQEDLTQKCANSSRYREAQSPDCIGTLWALIRLMM